jgi:hypothetical protein
MRQFLQMKELLGPSNAQFDFQQYGSQSPLPSIGDRFVRLLIYMVVEMRMR